MSYIPTVGFLIVAVVLFFNDHPIAGGWCLFIAWTCVPSDMEDYGTRQDDDQTF